MEPVTHVLTGACLARAGFNRRAAYATLTMAIAAEMPDIDVLWRVRGPVESFAHHRGITHTFIGLPVEAGVLLAVVFGLHRWRMARSKGSPASTFIRSASIKKPLTAAPVRWGWLYMCALVALLSHLLLDYTNNYGIRPFYPFNGHWYAASIVFIFDPVIFTLLLLALLAPSLFGLVNAEVGGKRQRFRGRGMAIGALVCMVALWAFRYVQHSRAEEIAFQQTYELQMQPVAVTEAPTVAPARAGNTVANEEADDKGDAPTDNKDNSATAETELVQPPGRLLQVQRVEVSPDPVNPYHWSVAMDYGALYQLATVDVRRGEISPDQVTYPKVAQDAVLRAAEASPLGRAYLDWSPMPILSEEEPVAAIRSGAQPVNRVTFRDPRFMGDVSWLRLSSGSPLTATVTVDDNGRVVRQTMDGHSEPAGRGAVADVHWNLSLFRRESPGSRSATPNRAAVRVKTVVNETAMVTSQPATLTPQPAPPAPVTPAPTVPRPEKPHIKPAPAPRHIVVMKPTPATAKAGPNVFDWAYEGAAARVHRFEAWLQWLANPK